MAFNRFTYLFASQDVFTTTSTFLLCLVVFLIVFKLLSHVNRRGLPPGPVGLPLIGSTVTLAISAFFYSEHPHDFMTRLAEKYGRVFCLGFGGQSRIVVLNSYASVTEAFKSPDLNDRPVVSVFKETLGADGILTSSGPTWKHQRRFSLSVFRSFGVGRKTFEEKIMTEAECLSQELTDLSGKPFNPKHHLMNATSNIICSIIFGQRFDYNDNNFKGILRNLDDRIKLAGSGALALIIPSLSLFMPSIVPESKRLLRESVAYFRPILESHKSRRETHDECNDFIDLYLKEIEKINRLDDAASDKEFLGRVDEQHLYAIIDSLFVAGTETSSNTLGWSLLYMAAYPDIQARILDEVKMVCGERFPAYSDQDHMPYTEAVILELQRLHTIVPLGVPHCAGRDTTIQGYVIPQGTIVIANLWGVMHDPGVWNDPDVFKPERFLDANGQIVLPKEWIPFSTGRRICLGERLAKMEIFLFLTHLISKFEFKKIATQDTMCFKGRSGATFSPLPFQISAISRE